MERIRFFGVWEGWKDGWDWCGVYRIEMIMVMVMILYVLCCVLCAVSGRLV